MVPIVAAFRRMVRDVEFDVCEMAPTTYLIARRAARRIALPSSCGAFITAASWSGPMPIQAEGPRRQARRRARLFGDDGVWTRGCHWRYGLDASKVTWVVDDEEHVATLKLPATSSMRRPNRWRA